MNLQRGPKVDPVRVLIANPLSATTQLVVVKVLNGYVFGSHQLVDVILLVYSNEVETAERLKLELQKCAFPCINSINVSTDLPRVTDADVFCFTTNFKNPNVFNIDGMNDDKQFDTLYLLIKIANGLHGPTKEESDETSEKYVKSKRKIILPEKKALKPIFLADGLVAIDILKSLSHNMPEDVFFCPTPLEDIIETILAEYLKVKRYLLNDMLIWAADDQVFHAEVDKPLVRDDKVSSDSRCSQDVISNELLEDVNLDTTTHLTASWLKKELMEKSLASSRKNPYGCIYKACAFAKTLKDIWTMRSSERTFHTNLGVISDGSVETIKGCAYVLPVIFAGETWTVNTRYHDYFHVKQEIKRINKAKQKSHKQLIPYCKKFLTENVIYQSFAVNVEEESDDFSPCLDSSRPSLAPTTSTEVK